MDVFTQFFLGASTSPSFTTVTGPTSPSRIPVHVNFYETRDNFIIECALPGYTKEDVDVSINNGRRITITANPSKSEDFLESKVYAHNFAHVILEREIELPEFLDTSHVQVNMHDGLLKILLKRRSEEEQKLTINGL